MNFEKFVSIKMEKSRLSNNLIKCFVGIVALMMTISLPTYAQNAVTLDRAQIEQLKKQKQEEKQRQKERQRQKLKEKQQKEQTVRHPQTLSSPRSQSGSSHNPLETTAKKETSYVLINGEPHDNEQTVDYTNASLSYTVNTNGKKLEIEPLLNYDWVHLTWSRSPNSLLAVVEPNRTHANRKAVFFLRSGSVLRKIRINQRMMPVFSASVTNVRNLGETVLMGEQCVAVSLRVTIGGARGMKAFLIGRFSESGKRILVNDRYKDRTFMNDEYSFFPQELSGLGSYYTKDVTMFIPINAFKVGKGKHVITGSFKIYLDGFGYIDDAPSGNFYICLKKSKKKVKLLN